MVGVAAALVLTVSIHAAGATGVRIALSATVEMQCGWPGPRVEVVFPAAERMPAQIAPAAVLVDGKRPASVTRSGRTISISIARPGGVMCDVIGPGRLHVVFTQAAHLGNPTRAGHYRLAVRHGAETASGAFSIR